MAYTYREAIKTAYKYLQIDVSKVEIIAGTNGRGIVYPFEGKDTVIFIYPISCKQNNKQNFFDTRDSGAKERALTWKYATDKNLRYFCFGFNEEQERYKEYVLSLESDEKSIRNISYRKAENSDATGTQVNIPNDFIPSKKFERIKTPKGFYIAAIKKEFIFEYINMFDNRPYQNIEEIGSFIESEEEESDEYIRAANYLKRYACQNEIVITERSDIEKSRDEFLKRFSPKKLSSIDDNLLLEKMFYTNGDNTDTLCYWLEVNKDCKKLFGSISGGSAYKFGLFQKKDTGVWQTGSSVKPIDLSHEEALTRAKAIRYGLLMACKYVENFTLNTAEDYERLDDILKQETSNDYFCYNWAWVHKYLSIIYPDRISSYHSDDWQMHILRSLGIKPSEKYYGRSGQIAIIQKYANWTYRQFYDVAYSKFGNVKQFIRLGSSDEEKNYALEWMKNSIVAIGWPELGSLDNYRDDDGRLDKESIILKLKEEYYPKESMSSTATRKAGELVRFYETNSDSVFVVMDGEKLVGLVDDIGQYVYDDSLNMPNVKSGKWHTPFDETDTLPNKSEGKLTSCFQIKDDENLMYLYKKYYFGEDMEEGKKNMEMELKNCLEVQMNQRENAIYPLNQIIYGAPGTGKTYSTAEYAIAIIENHEADLSKKSYEERKAIMKKYNDYVRNGRIVFTTFHQSYGYEEFIQGLRPDTNSDKMSFKTVDGVFKHIADVALNNPENNYVIIIDEINRANISKVFGELITLIEEDKRWGELNETCATLQSGDVFAVPNNLYIIGTMNSADKSISLIDAALRRRFEFVEQKPNPELIDDPSLKNVFTKMNSKLADELDSSDLLIGHSYFMNKSEATLPKIMNNSVIPLLYEYFYDNKKKVASVLDYSLGDLKIEILDDKLGRLSVEKKAD